MAGANASLFRSLLENIRNDIDIKSNLSQLKVALIALNTSSLTQLAPTLQIDVIFDCLNSSDRDQIHSCCEILNAVLRVLPLSVVFSRFSVALNRALVHPEKDVKEVVLLENFHKTSNPAQETEMDEKLIRSTSEPALINELHNDPSLLKNVIACLCDEELSVGNHAIDFLTRLGKIPEGLTIICHPSVKQSLIEAIGSNELYKIRLYQVVIDISVDSYETLKKVEKEGFVEGLCESLSTDDVLARLALMEELTKLAVTTHGFEFMRKQKLLDLMVQQLDSCQSDTLSSLTCPGIIKFFGSVGQKYPSELFSAYPNILTYIFEAVSSEDLPISITALETVGFIATAPAGKKLLVAQDKKYMAQVMNKMEHAMTALSNEWRVRAVNAVANIIHLEDCSPEDKLSEAAQLWFNKLGSNAMTDVLKMAQQPFPDLKLAAMQVLVKLSRHSWGQEKIRDCQGLMAYLLDRTTESAIEGMQAKYDILSNIVESSSGSEVFKDSDYWRLKEYVKQGTCFAPRVTEVAFEGQPN